MLPVGIAIMVASIVIGIVALTLVALTSSTARSAGRATRTAMYPPGQQEAAPYYDRAGESAPRYEADAAYQPAEQDTPQYVLDSPPERDGPPGGPGRARLPRATGRAPRAGGTARRSRLPRRTASARLRDGARGRAAMGPRADGPARGRPVGRTADRDDIWPSWNARR